MEKQQSEKEQLLRKEIKSLSTQINVAMSFDYNPLELVKKVAELHHKMCELGHLKLDERMIEIIAGRQG